jgi:hypothetical protein
MDGRDLEYIKNSGQNLKRRDKKMSGEGRDTKVDVRER